MRDAERRARVVAAARGWLGTPYRHQASVKGEGADCLGLVRGVWREAVGEEPEAPPPYRPDWAEVGGEETLWGAAAAGGDRAGAGGAGRRVAVPHGGRLSGQALRRVERGRRAGAADDPRLLGAVSGRKLDGGVVAQAFGRGVSLA